MNTRFDPVLLFRFVKIQVPCITAPNLNKTLIVDIQNESVYTKFGEQVCWQNDKRKPLKYNIDTNEFYYIEHYYHKTNRDSDFN